MSGQGAAVTDVAALVEHIATVADDLAESYCTCGGVAACFPCQSRDEVTATLTELAARVAVVQAQDTRLAADSCGAWGGCVLPAGHNQGKADVPEAHDTRLTTIRSLLDDLERGNGLAHGGVSCGVCSGHSPSWDGHSRNCRRAFPDRIRAALDQGAQP